MKKLTLSIISILTLGASAYSAPINEADWDFATGSHYENGAIFFDAECIVGLKNGENFSKKSKLSYTIEIPTELLAFGGSEKSVSISSFLFGNYTTTATAVISSGANYNFANTYVMNNPDTNLEFITQAVNGTTPLHITFSFEYSDGKCIASIKSDTDSRIDGSKTFTGNSYENYSEFSFYVGNISGDIDLAQTPIKVIDFSYTPQVPEPATYAAIFGVLALGFVIYRRRK